MDTRLKKEQRDRRRKRIRAKISGTAKIPRLSVFRSNRYISAQLIDDIKGDTLVAVSSKTFKGKNNKEKARAAGINLAEKAKAKKITEVVFDRGGYIYTGSVASLADGAREGGLKF